MAFEKSVIIRYEAKQSGNKLLLHLLFVDALFPKQNNLCSNGLSPSRQPDYIIFRWFFSQFCLRQPNLKAKIE
jgi:hypothetical protein